MEGPDDKNTDQQEPPQHLHQLPPEVLLFRGGQRRGGWPFSWGNGRVDQEESSTDIRAHLFVLAVEKARSLVQWRLLPGENGLASAEQ